MPIHQLGRALVFPPVAEAEPDGLLAMGGDLSMARLLLAYRSGIFPWYEAGVPIFWWSPDPRFVLMPAEFKVATSLRRIVRSGLFTVTFDQAFAEVMAQCGRVARKDQEGTWITPEMEAAYGELHAIGHAHSVEVWREGRLVGGLYGVELGRAYFGESMFMLEPNASKVGFVHLVEALVARGCLMIDCQVHTQHLERFGARYVARAEFLRRLAEAVK
ncbi:MAG: leucyl/phenylalanyl-tRNA--protein transferase [Verrucomicrobia bacterium]|nr:leucyl/phenylalanyl-tRNA--protein transferase [Verrucomicrobiota bacterium]